MNLASLWHWIWSDWTHAVVAVIAALVGYALGWAAVKVAIEKVTGRPVPRNGLTLTLDVLAELANNLAGALNRVLKERGGAGLFLPSPQPPGTVVVTSPAPAETVAREIERAAGRPPSQSGRASVALLLVLVVPSGVVVIGCPVVSEVAMRSARGVPDPNGCVPDTQLCFALPGDAGETTAVCSDSHRPWPSLPRRPDGTQRTCANGCELTDAGVARCRGDGGVR